MTDLLIRNGSVVLDDRVEVLDIAIDGGRIVALTQEPGRSAAETIDATGLHVFPGVIDPHVHFNEPGRTDWEGVATGSAALAAGGGTTYFDMPLNSDPPVLTGAQFDAKRIAGEASAVTDFALWGGLTPDNLDHLDELAERGVIGFKAFMSNSGISEFNAVDDYTLYRGMEIAAKHGLIVAVHAESDALAAGFTRAAIAAGKMSMADYLATRPPVVEVEAIRRALTLAEATGCALHVVHVSTWQGALEVAASQGNVTCETCPHYLLLNADDAVQIGPNAKCAPPIRDEASRARLVDELKSGAIDFVGSDHSPSPASMKQSSNAFENWGGIAGVQSTLAALLTLGVRPMTVGKLTAGHVAKRFGLAGKGSIAVGHDADLAIVAVDEAFTLRQADLLDRHKLSPYVGRQFRGAVKRTIVRGRTVFENGRIVSPPLGRLLRPPLVPSPDTPGEG
ncbi:MAG TPA: allantoinase AllB [Tepidisphaeraceae bacterium]|jgi:allantoinase